MKISTLSDWSLVAVAASAMGLGAALAQHRFERTPTPPTVNLPAILPAAPEPTVAQVSLSPTAFSHVVAILMAVVACYCFLRYMELGRKSDLFVAILSAILTMILSGVFFR